MRPQGTAAGRRALGTAACGLSLAAALTGCGGGGAERDDAPVAPGGVAAGTPALPASYAAPLARSLPKTIAIPRLGVSAPVSQLGLKPDGRIQEPPLSRPNLAGWWKEGPTPGEGGPSVILGHVDANKRAAVFYRLKDLKPGDRVRVGREDGGTATFAVQRVERVAKASFPGEKVYAEDLDYPALRLVTCGGTFNPRTGHYVDNVIVYTRLVRS